MKASELIKELETFIKNNGDNDIYVENLDGTGVYSRIDSIKHMNEIYTGTWNSETKSNSIKQKIFLLGKLGYGEFV